MSGATVAGTASSGSSRPARPPGPEMLRALRATVAADGRDMLFVARTLLACCIALYVAFALQLQSPMSSVTTVVIVAAPTNGAIVSKSLWRLIGTVIGAAAAVLLMAWFAQSPVLFIAALSLCIGVACFVSSLLRFFKAYGAVLAGYTIIIVSAGAFHAPDDIFLDALSRLSAVSVGLASAAAVFLLTVLPRTSALGGTIEALLRDVAALFVRLRQEGDIAADQPRLRPALLARIVALDEGIEYGAAESYALRRRRRRFRLATSRLLALLSAVEPVHATVTPSPAVARARRLAHEAMARVADRSAALPVVIADLQRAEEALAEMAEHAGTGDELLVALHERDLLGQARRTALALLPGGESGAVAAQRRVRLRPLPEWHAAGRNAVRGALVTLIAGLFWYVSQWPSGPSLLAYLVPASCLLATNPSASRASVQFATGTLIGVPMALFCQIMLLPQIDGFPLLAASLCLCLAPGIWLQTRPRFRLMATGFSVFFCAMISVHNPIAFDDVALFNNLSTFVIGPGLLVMVFRVLLPADVSGDARRFARSLTAAVERLARRGVRGIAAGTDRLGVEGFEHWQDQQMQKVLRLEQRAAQLPPEIGRRAARAAYLVLALGRTAVSLRALRRRSELPPDVAAALDAGLAAMGHVSRDPAAARDRIAAAGRGLDRAGAEEAAGGERPDAPVAGPAGNGPALPVPDASASPAPPPPEAAIPPAPPDDRPAEMPAAARAADRDESASGTQVTPPTPPDGTAPPSARAPIAADRSARLRREARGLLGEAALLIEHADGLLRAGCPLLRPDWRPGAPGDERTARC
ncbi:FUSC family protein [Rhizosaccharibacter radicis]|uniref:FUSC family protein n=1 Tax=Rhizosaccharibacter radicis TaxID=2782605 RepID=A0ABT1W0B5_9PROT|nr:FUSC family protein [Acetobacteraceae bacterium KSS12]